MLAAGRRRRQVTLSTQSHVHYTGGHAVRLYHYVKARVLEDHPVHDPCTAGRAPHPCPPHPFHDRPCRVLVVPAARIGKSQPWFFLVLSSMRSKRLSMADRPTASGQRLGLCRPRPILSTTAGTMSRQVPATASARCENMSAFGPRRACLRFLPLGPWRPAARPRGRRRTRSVVAAARDAARRDERRAARPPAAGCMEPPRCNP